MSKPVSKAVIPAAGLGTRFLPATKAMPKEMLPVVDRPAIQYVVEESVAGGLTDLLMITGRNKTPLENHFDRVAELEDELEARGDAAKLAAVRAATQLADVHYLRQGQPLGLGHAVLRAKQHVGDEPFAVLLGDDLLMDGGAFLREMVRVHSDTGASVIAVQPVPADQVSSYGVIAPMLDPDGGAVTLPGYGAAAIRVAGLVEKPAVAEAPSHFAVIGRYVLRPEVFEVLERTGPGRGGEIQLTDALQVLAADPDRYGGVVAMEFDGRRYDTGNKLEYLKANIELATRHPEIGADVRAWLREFAASLEPDD